MPQHAPGLTAHAHRACRLLLALLLVVVAWLAFTPAPPPQADTGWDKANHALAFFVLALLAEAGWWPHPQRRARVALGLLAYGAWIEAVQSFIPQRSGEWADGLADAAGIMLALLVTAALSAVLKRRPVTQRCARRWPASPASPRGRAPTARRGRLLRGGHRPRRGGCRRSAARP